MIDSDDRHSEKPGETRYLLLRHSQMSNTSRHDVELWQPALREARGEICKCHLSLVYFGGKHVPIPRYEVRFAK